MANGIISMKDIQVEEGSIEEAYAVSLFIPEFQPHYTRDTWAVRLRDKVKIILIASIDGKKAGCKVGYFEGDEFYSWIGGVLPVYRKMGVATKLADTQEAMVRASGMSRIRMKTRNRFGDMLRFAQRRGFTITDVEEKGDPVNWRITLYKNL